MTRSGHDCTVSIRCAYNASTALDCRESIIEVD
jgi:hypothetical protein